MYLLVLAVLVTKVGIVNCELLLIEVQSLQGLDQRCLDPFGVVIVLLLDRRSVKPVQSLTRRF